MNPIDQHRANFARAHGGKYIVQLGQQHSLLPGTVTTAVSVGSDGRTVTYVARPVDGTNPSHMRVFGITIKAIPESDSLVVSTDDQGSFARWSYTFDSPVLTVTV